MVMCGLRDDPRLPACAGEDLRVHLSNGAVKLLGLQNTNRLGCAVPSDSTHKQDPPQLSAQQAPRRGVTPSPLSGFLLPRKLPNVWLELVLFLEECFYDILHQGWGG